MRLGEVLTPIGTERQQVEEAVAEADVFPLLAAVAQWSGDMSLLRGEFRPDPERLLEPDAGLSPESVAKARELAVDALMALGERAAPGTDHLLDIFRFLVGSAADRYFSLLLEELAPPGTDARAPGFQKGELAPDRKFEVAIIGAGMSGLAVGHRLSQAGISFTIFEKNPDVGGTWYENTYPGCRVDVSNHLYSYSFAQTNEWPEFFSSKEVLLDYFRSCADAFGLRPFVELETEVLSAKWDEKTQRWTLEVRSRGEAERRQFDAVVSAVGQLNQPSLPEIVGMEAFAGPSFHSARWDHSVSLSEKRVAVIGTGASAVQFIPAVAEDAASVTVFQRTPPWLVPTPNYTDHIGAGVEFVLRHVPGYARWDRLWLFWRTHEGILPMAKVDPDWPHRERSVSEANDLLRQLLTGYLQMEFPEPELFEKVLPQYPPIAKRVIRDNGIWAKTLRRENVDLVTADIAEITPAGIRTADGEIHEADVIIYGTGFKASRFLTPMEVHGAGDVELNEHWKGDARAYLGITVPRFPNLMLCYGPNTNIVINGSIVYFSECEAHYISELLRELLSSGHRSFDCRLEVHDAYNARIDAANAEMAWGASSVNSWYKNEFGRTAQNWPYSLLEYWEQTRELDAAEYVWH